MSEEEVLRLAEVLQRDIAPLAPAELTAMRFAPPVRIIDCVLSLRANYLRTVLPRIEQFSSAHPRILTCPELAEAMQVSGPAQFMTTTLRMNHPTKAQTLLGVTRFAITVQKGLQGATEEQRLTAWAAQARPGDYITVGVKGFGLAGFQYLRMLFGADTTKPDVHIVAFVSSVLDRKVPDIQALLLLEEASRRAGLSVRAVDGRIWERSAGR